MLLKRLFKIKKRKAAVRVLDVTTEIFQVIVGVSFTYILHQAYPDTNLTTMLLIGVFFSLLPDLDHFLSLYLYNSKSSFSLDAKGFLKRKEFLNFWKYCSKNHKTLTNVYGHNILTFLVVLLIGWNFFSNGLIIPGTIFLTCALHYAWDMVEDLIYFGRLNPNWFLKFNR